MDANEQNKEPVRDECPPVRNLRDERLRELMDAALRDSDPLQANLLAGACGFMKMAAKIDEVIGESIQGSCKSLDDLRKLVGPIDLQLKISRQYDRLVGLVTRVRNAEREPRTIR